MEIWFVSKVENVLFSSPPPLRYDNNPIFWIAGLNCVPIGGTAELLANMHCVISRMRVIKTPWPIMGIAEHLNFLRMLAIVLTVEFTIF